MANGSHQFGKADLESQSHRDPPRGSRTSTVFFTIALLLVAVATAAAIGAALETYRADTKTLDGTEKLVHNTDPTATVRLSPGEDSDQVIGVVLSANTAGRLSLMERHWLDAVSDSDLPIEVRHAADTEGQREALGEFAARSDVNTVILVPGDPALLTSDVTKVQEQGIYVVAVATTKQGDIPADVVVGFEPSAIADAIELARTVTDSAGTVPITDGTGDATQQVTALIQGDVAALIYLDGTRTVQAAISAASELRHSDYEPGEHTQQIWVSPQIVTPDNASDSLAKNPELAAVIAQSHLGN